MGIISWLIFGGLAGWVASMITKDNPNMGILANIVVGIVGAFIGGFIAEMAGGRDISGFNLYSFGIAVLGSVILLVVLRMIRGGRR